MKHKLLTLLALPVMLLPTGCTTKEGPLEEAGETADEAIEEAGDAIDEVIDEAEDVDDGK